MSEEDKHKLSKILYYSDIHPAGIEFIYNIIYDLQQENKQLKEELKNKPDTKWTMATEDGKEYTIIQSERIDMQEELNKTNTKLFNQLNNKDSILTELEEWLKEETKLSDDYLIGECHTDYTDVLDKIQELKEKYK